MTDQKYIQEPDFFFRGSKSQSITRMRPCSDPKKGAEQALHK